MLVLSRIVIYLLVYDAFPTEKKRITGGEFDLILRKKLIMSKYPLVSSKNLLSLNSGTLRTGVHTYTRIAEINGNH